MCNVGVTSCAELASLDLSSGRVLSGLSRPSISVAPWAPTGGVLAVTVWLCQVVAWDFLLVCPGFWIDRLQNLLSYSSLEEPVC